MPRGRDQKLLDAIGARVARIRRERGLSQEALAARVGVQPESVSRCETGQSGLSLHNLARLAAALDVSLGDLVDVERPSPEPARRPDVAALLRAYDGLDDRGRALALRLVKDVAAAWPRTEAEPGAPGQSTPEGSQSGG
ncbi:MAG: helix-turn-helix domain-containing protein [Myxococcota bacterium]